MNSQDTTPSAQSPTRAPTQDNSTAIIGFVLAFLFAPLGLIFSVAGLKKARQLGGVGKGLAIAGLIVSIPGMLFVAWLGYWMFTYSPPGEPPADMIFRADTASESVRVVRDPLEDSGEPDTSLRQTFHYQPTTPASCHYHLSQIAVDRDSLEPDDWSSYTGPVAIGIQSGAYILARDCDQWRLVDNP